MEDLPDDHLTYFQKFASTVGLTPPALTLFLSLLSGYPFALVHRFYLYGKSQKLQHLYFIIVGLSLGYLNYGRQIGHNLFTVIFVYLTFLKLSGTVLSVVIVFFFTMTYLLIGYLYTSTNQYDITWTMPYCILTLRLIGTAIDLYDGKQPPEKQTKDVKQTALEVRPSFLEIMGHSFFPTSFLIGPQFPMRRYLDFVKGTFSTTRKDGHPQPVDCIDVAVRRFFSGVIYCMIFYTLQIFVSNDYLLSEEFVQLSLVRRLWLLGLWGRFTLYKYITCWLFAEGACILFGITYNGTDQSGKPLWDGCENVKLSVFENATEFNHYIQSFNTNTNNWVAKYVYKRLKFLGNRFISQGTALLFLAIWHGLHSGYYVCFFMEFIVMYMEKDLRPIIESNAQLKSFLRNPFVSIALYIIMRLYTFVFMGWCLIPFVYLTASTYWKVFKNVNLVGFLLFGLYPILYRPFLLKFVKKKQIRQDHAD